MNEKQTKTKQTNKHKIFSLEEITLSYHVGYSEGLFPFRHHGISVSTWVKVKLGQRLDSTSAADLSRKWQVTKRQNPYEYINVEHEGNWK